MLGKRAFSPLNTRLFNFVSIRFFAKRYPADESQLFYDEYQHKNLQDHYQFMARRLKAAKQLKTPPISNDYRSSSEDEEILKKEKQIAEDVERELEEKYKKNFEEIYTQIRKFQIEAKDDITSKYYYANEEDAKEAARREAQEKVGQILASEVIDDNDEPFYYGATKKKIEKSLERENYKDAFVSTHIPERDHPQLVDWEPYTIPELPFVPKNVDGDSRNKCPIALPKWRYPKLDKDGNAAGRGSRKSARASVIISEGTGQFVCNGKRLIEYFPALIAREYVLAPLLASETLCSLDVIALVTGGGNQGQAGAVRQAISNALVNLDPSYRNVLKMGSFFFLVYFGFVFNLFLLAGLLRVDARVVERKKPGKRKARRSFQ